MYFPTKAREILSNNVPVIILFNDNCSYVTIVLSGLSMTASLSLGQTNGGAKIRNFGASDI